jgi:peptidoglycan-associated lipoprotein
VGAGAGVGTETNFLHTYGLNGLVGAKLALTNSVSLRADGIVDWLANNNWKSFKSAHLGLSVYRHPAVSVVTRTVTVAGPATVTVATVQRPDSVSAEEQARLRRIEGDYRDLRDSLARSRHYEQTASGSVALPPDTTMQEKIHFATNKSDLSAKARAILDAKVQVFRANPGMRIVIEGNTDERASDAYNMRLGERRSAAAKRYLVAQGIAADRIKLDSDGKRNPTAAGTSKTAEALNRRDEFRLLIAGEPTSRP